MLYNLAQVYQNPFSTEIVFKKLTIINIYAKILMALSEEKRIIQKSHETVPLRDMWTNPCLSGAVFYCQAHTRPFEDQLSRKDKM
jgi:hypothetical protein